MTNVRELVIKTISDQNLSQREVAKSIRYSASALTNYLNGRYGAGVAKIEAALVAWLRKVGVAVSDDALPTRFIDTKASAAVYEACASAQEEGCVAVVIGPPGVGKTMGLRAWERDARKENLPFVSVEADVATTYVALIRKIARALDLGDGKPAAALLDAIKERLARVPALLIIDESQHLNVRALEAVRSIHDATGAGVVFAGSLMLSATFEEGDGSRYELAQLQDRVAIFERITPLSATEISSFAHKWLGSAIDDPEALSMLREQSRGVPRRLVRLLSHCRRMSDGGSKKITEAMVRDAARRLVGAQREAA